MKQFNMNVDAEFEQALERLMKGRGFATKADAVRKVVAEAAGPAKDPDYDFTRMLGIALGPGLDPNPRFKSDDDLW
ncbi:MAG: hypothetical protein NTV70_03740 [Acidobacteria bacterium]|nr:hypothetical protein [Acidobacteriota bacterium]